MFRATVGSSVKFCARQRRAAQWHRGGGAGVGEDDGGLMQRRQRRGAVTVAWSVAVQWRRRAGGASRRSQPLSLIGLGFGRWELWLQRRTSCLVPLVLTSFYGAARRGPISLPWAERPRSGRESGSIWSVGPKWWRSILTFSPLISSCLLTYLNLYFQYSLFFVYLLHHGLVHMSMPHRHGQ